MGHGERQTGVASAVRLPSDAQRSLFQQFLFIQTLRGGRRSFNLSVSFDKCGAGVRTSEMPPRESVLADVAPIPENDSVCAWSSDLHQCLIHFLKCVQSRVGSASAECFLDNPTFQAANDTKIQSGGRSTRKPRGIGPGSRL